MQNFSNGYPKRCSERAIFMKYSHVIIPPHDRNRPNFVIATIYIDVHIIYLHFYKMFIFNNFWLVSVLKSIRKQRVRAAHQSEEQ